MRHPGWSPSLRRAMAKIWRLNRRRDPQMVRELWRFLSRSKAREGEME